MSSTQATLHNAVLRPRNLKTPVLYYEPTLLELFWFPEGRRHVDVSVARTAHAGTVGADNMTYAEWESYQALHEARKVGGAVRHNKESNDEVR